MQFSTTTPARDPLIAGASAVASNLHGRRFTAPEIPPCGVRCYASPDTTANEASDIVPRCRGFQQQLQSLECSLPMQQRSADARNRYVHAVQLYYG